MKTIKMITNEKGADGESLKAGEQYSLNDASADRWLLRKKAEVVENEKETKPKAQGDKEDQAPEKANRTELEQAATARKIKFDAKTSDSDLRGALANPEPKSTK